MQVPNSDLPVANHSGPNQIKASLSLWDRNFRTKINRNIKKFTFLMLWVYKCSSWASRNCTVQVFFLKCTRNIRNMFLIVLREYIFHNFEWAEVHKIREVFWVKVRVKWVIFLASFCWLVDFLPTNFKLIDNYKYEVFTHLFSGTNLIFWVCFRAI